MSNCTVGMHFSHPTKHRFLEVFGLDDKFFKEIKIFIWIEMLKHCQFTCKGPGTLFDNFLKIL
jgi:hypothetical protein